MERRLIVPYWRVTKFDCSILASTVGSVALWKSCVFVRCSFHGSYVTYCTARLIRTQGLVQSICRPFTISLVPCVDKFSLFRCWFSVFNFYTCAWSNPPHIQQLMTWICRLQISVSFTCLNTWDIPIGLSILHSYQVFSLVIPVMFTINSYIQMIYLQFTTLLSKLFATTVRLKIQVPRV